jgi:hypothetical protein
MQAARGGALTEVEEMELQWLHCPQLAHHVVRLVVDLAALQSLAMQALAGMVDSPAVEEQVAEQHWTVLETQAQAELAALEQQLSQHIFTNA